MGAKSKICLSKRLQNICDMVTPGRKVVDVGCDHGFVPIYLVQERKCPHVLAMDVRTGPLSMAREHIRERGLEESIETRLSDGLEAYCSGEAEVLICAGMGGALIHNIIARAGGKITDFQELILQPQSEIPEFRRFLRESGFRIVEEAAVFEDGKYYFPMKALPEYENRRQKLRSEDGQRSSGREMEEIDKSLADRFGGLLLERRDPVLFRYLTERLEAKRKVIQEVEKNESFRAGKRLQVLKEDESELCRALGLYGEATSQ